MTDRRSDSFEASKPTTSNATRLNVTICIIFAVELSGPVPDMIASLVSNANAENIDAHNMAIPSVELGLRNILAILMRTK